ncbi:hypothetical protein [Inquilinus sp. CA228]|uniref:hypothetical protein n=1 Tax=Inquilinus sp. CA228 TaxID=3455609 RepID=UPI003F8D7F90
MINLPLQLEFVARMLRVNVVAEHELVVLKEDQGMAMADYLECAAEIVRCLMAQPGSPAARICGELPEGVVDLAAARRRRAPRGGPLS